MMGLGHLLCCFTLITLLAGCACEKSRSGAIVTPEAVHRFEDSFWFGAIDGLWRAHAGVSCNAVPVHRDFGKVTGLETSDSKLLVSTNRGIFCLTPDLREVERISPKVRVDGFFRKGGTRWATTRDFDLLALDLTTDQCKTMTAVPVDLGGRKFFTSERAEDILYLAACYFGEGGTFPEKPCALYSSTIPKNALRFWNYSTPLLVAEYPNIHHMIYIGGSLWVATKDGIFEITKESSKSKSRQHLKGSFIWHLFQGGNELWASSPEGSWRWSQDRPTFEKVVSLGEISSLTTNHEFSWATFTKGNGLYRWQTNSGKPPQLVHSGITRITSVVRWNGCDWLGSDKGLLRACSRENWTLKRVAPGIESVTTLRLAGFAKGTVHNAGQRPAPDFLWAGTDTGVVRLSADASDIPIIMDSRSPDADLIIAGNYLWLLSYGRIARWKLDSTGEIETLTPAELGQFRTLKMCTDINSLWIITSKGLVRVPDVRGGVFNLDFDEILKAQNGTDINDVLRYHDTRYWNCQEVRHKAPLNFEDLNRDFEADYDPRENWK